MLAQLADSVRYSRVSQAVLGCLFLGVAFLIYLPFIGHQQVGPRQFTMDEVHIKEQTRFFEVDGNPINLFYLDAMPSTDLHVDVSLRVPVLLLHGAAFTSKIWKDTRTLQLLASLGHHAIAVDLPGYGRTAAPDNLDPYQFMAMTIHEMRLGIFSAKQKRAFRYSEIRIFGIREVLNARR